MVLRFISCRIIIIIIIIISVNLLYWVWFLPLIVHLMSRSCDWWSTSVQCFSPIRKIHAPRPHPRYIFPPREVWKLAALTRTPDSIRIGEGGKYFQGVYQHSVLACTMTFNCIYCPASVMVLLCESGVYVCLFVRYFLYCTKTLWAVVVKLWQWTDNGSRIVPFDLPGGSTLQCGVGRSFIRLCRYLQPFILADNLLRV